MLSMSWGGQEGFPEEKTVTISKEVLPRVMGMLLWHPGPPPSPQDPPMRQQTNGLRCTQSGSLLSNWSGPMSLQLLNTFNIMSESELAKQRREHIPDTNNSVCKGPGVSEQVLLLEEAGIPLPIFLPLKMQL